MSNHPNTYYNKPDALSSAISRLELTADIYVNGDFCGTWAVDTSGSRRTPFHLIASGTAWLHIDGQVTKKLTAGDLIVFPNDKQHVIASDQQLPQDIKINSPDLDANDNPTQMVCGFFDFANKASWLLLDSLSSVIILDLSENSDEIHARNLIKQMLYEFEDREPGHHAVTNQLAYLLFIEIIRQQIKKRKVKTGMLAALFDSRLSKALAVIHNHPEQNWTLEKLASEAAMGRSSFSSLFTEVAGIPAMRYLTAWRMEKAKVLLETTRLPMWQIAEQSGYQSEASFQKAFKKAMQQTPGQVRRSSTRINK